jgi:hypothetical protein
MARDGRKCYGGTRNSEAITNRKGYIYTCTRWEEGGRPYFLLLFCVCVCVCDYSPLFPIYFGDWIPRDVKRLLSLSFVQILSLSLSPFGPSFDLFPLYFLIWFSSSSSDADATRRGQRGSTQRVLLLARRQIGSLSSTAPRYTTTAHINLHFLFLFFFWRSFNNINLCLPFLLWCLYV